MLKKSKWKGGFVLLSLVVASWIYHSTDKERPRETTPLTKALAGDHSQFARAIRPRLFEFPADHGPHSDYKTEWWYVTGNVATPQGREFGYQVTFFRVGLSALKSAVESQWASNEFYMAHVAISDISNKKFYSHERFARTALGLAGAQTSPQVKIWLEDWWMQGKGSELFPLMININDSDIQLSLTMSPEKKIVLQGDNGLSQKGPEPGNASYYYSFTRLATEGKIRVGVEEYNVSGSSWLDREWSTSMLPEGVAGWDWFSVQLDNETELMFYRLRSVKGGATKWSKGSLILPNGDKINLSAEQVSVTPLQWWRSPNSNINYPLGWSLKVLEYNIDLQIEAAMPDQELNHSVRYWEGSINVTGKYQQQSVKGKGYLELAGYDF